MIFFIVLAVVSVIGFFPSMLFTAEIMNSETLFFIVMINFIFTFVYSVIAIIVISVKKKDCPNVCDIKAFENKSISIFWVIFAFILLFGLVCVIGGSHTILAFAILVLLLVSLISMPVVIHTMYRRQEKKEVIKVFEELTNNNQENEK